MFLENLLPPFSWQKSKPSVKGRGDDKEGGQSLRELFLAKGRNLVEVR